MLDDGGSPPVDSIDVLQRGQGSPGDLGCSLHHSLHDGAVPHSDAAGQDGLNNAAVEVVEDFW